MSQFVHPSQSSNLAMRHFETIPKTPIYLNVGHASPMYHNSEIMSKAGFPKWMEKILLWVYKFQHLCYTKLSTVLFYVIRVWGSLLEKKARQIKPVCSKDSTGLSVFTSINNSKEVPMITTLCKGSENTRTKSLNLKFPILL